MRTKIDPWKLSLALMKRSPCRVQVGAVVTDREGRVFAWGWNHAEQMATVCARSGTPSAGPTRNGWPGLQSTSGGSTDATKHSPSRARCAKKH